MATEGRRDGVKRISRNFREEYSDLGDANELYKKDERENGQE